MQLLRKPRPQNEDGYPPGTVVDLLLFMGTDDGPEVFGTVRVQITKWAAREDDGRRLLSTGEEIDLDTAYTVYGQHCIALQDLHPIQRGMQFIGRLSDMRPVYAD